MRLCCTMTVRTQGFFTGRVQPSQTLPSGRGLGKPGFPMSQPLLGAAGAPTGRGAVRQAHRRWGNPVSLYVHLSHPRGCAAQRHDENRFFLGGLCPPKPSRQGGGWGNPVSPCPNRCWERLAPPQAGVRFDRLTTGGETRFPRMFTSASYSQKDERKASSDLVFMRTPYAIKRHSCRVAAREWP